MAAAYYASARLGLQLQFEATHATPVWPSSGLALAALLLFGWRISGGVLLGAFLANLVDLYVKVETPLPFGILNVLQHFASHPDHIVMSLAIGIGNTLEALAGFSLIRGFISGSDISNSVRSVLSFIFAAFLCCLIASTIGVTTLYIGGAVPLPLLSTAWLTWWLGDASGILIITPLILTLSQLRIGNLKEQPWFTMVIALLILFLFSETVFNGWFDPTLLKLTQLLFNGWLDLALFNAHEYLVIPILLWIAFKLGNLSTTLGIAITSTVAILGTAHGHGPFIESSQNESLLLLAGFIGVTSATVLLLDAALRERRQAHTELSRARDKLEDQVQERTFELRRVNDELSLRVSERDKALELLEREIAERRYTEDILRQSQKMEAIGQLTGGIAHDFNNILTVIVGNLDLLERHVASETGKRLIRAARRGAERGASLTDSLLAFARQHDLRPETIDPNFLIKEFTELIYRAATETNEIRIILDSAANTCRIDPAQFQSALLNLIVNARDAMPPAGGRITIKTENILVDERDAAADPEIRPGPYVVISVVDNGMGMPQAVLERAFEPFFTTKEVGKGSGLGLSQVYGFAKQSGGHVQLTSELGRGTTVRIYLPCSSAETAAQKEKEETENPPPAAAM